MLFLEVLWYISSFASVMVGILLTEYAERPAPKQHETVVTTSVHQEEIQHKQVYHYHNKKRDDDLLDVSGFFKHHGHT